MSVLAIETATSVCGAAVASEGIICSLAEVDGRNIHSDRLLPLIDDALEKAGTSPATVDAIAVSIGPGSFTGLRIGLSVAKGLVYATGKPLVAVPTLEALAFRIVLAGAGKNGQAILAVLDARRNEVYCQLFHTDGTGLLPAWEVGDLTVEQVISRLGDESVVVTGDAGKKIGSLATEYKRRISYADASLSKCSAGAVALLGERRFMGGMTEDASVLEPKYIKEFFLKVK